MEWNHPLLTAAAGFVLGFVSRWILDLRSERRALVRGIAQRYIDTATAQRDLHQSDPWFRLGLLQRCGAALLSSAELGRVCHVIRASGLADPAEATFGLFAQPLSALFASAIKGPLDLGDQEAVIRRLASDFDSRASNGGTS